MSSDNESDLGRLDRPLLDVQDLKVEFRTGRGTIHAVNGISFDIQAGEIVGMVGESGCGKSASVRGILGLLPSNGDVVSGSVTLQDSDLLKMRGRSMRRIRGQGIGFIAQNPFDVLNPVIPIRRQFFNALNAHDRISKAEARSRALTMLETVGLPGPERVLEGYAHELSGGMAQRVVISLALIHEPQLLIADEPTTALDVTVQRQILDTLRALIYESSRSMLLVTHDLGVVAQYCDRVVVLYAGKVVEVGPVNEVFGHPSHPYTLGLLRAVPRPGKELVALAGTLPDLIDYPRGCPFKDRCALRHDPCEDIEPPLTMFDDLRWRSCHATVEAVGQ